MITAYGDPETRRKAIESGSNELTDRWATEASLGRSCHRVSAII
jgi:hypothetical protein